jgi:hypothetical protein
MLLRIGGTFKRWGLIGSHWVIVDIRPPKRLNLVPVMPLWLPFPQHDLCLSTYHGELTRAELMFTPIFESSGSELSKPHSFIKYSNLRSSLF